MTTNRELDHCPIHGMTVFVQSSPMCKPHCELCIGDELRKRQALMVKPTHEYMPMGIATHRMYGVACTTHYHGFHVSSYGDPDPDIGLRNWLEKNDAFRRLFENLTSGERGYVAIESFEFQDDGIVIVHLRGEGVLVYKLEPIEEKKDAEPEAHR